MTTISLSAPLANALISARIFDDFLYVKKDRQTDEHGSFNTGGVTLFKSDMTIKI